MKIGMLVLRLVIGLLFVGHGMQKLAGWFGGGGIEGTAQGFDGMGLKPGRDNAVAAGISEAGGGALLAALVGGRVDVLGAHGELELGGVVDALGAGHDLLAAHEEVVRVGVARVGTERVVGPFPSEGRARTAWTRLSRTPQGTCCTRFTIAAEG